MREDLQLEVEEQIEILVHQLLQSWHNAIRREIEYTQNEKAQQEARAVRLDGQDYMDVSDTYALYGAFDGQRVPVFLMFTLGDNTDDTWCVLRQPPREASVDGAGQTHRTLRAVQLISRDGGKTLRFDPATEIELVNEGVKPLTHREEVKFNGHKTGREQVSAVNLSIKGNTLSIVPDGKSTLVVLADRRAMVASQS